MFLVLCDEKTYLIHKRTGSDFWYETNYLISSALSQFLQSLLLNQSLEGYEGSKYNWKFFLSLIYINKSDLLLIGNLDYGTINPI